MSQRLLYLTTRIQEELIELAQIVDRVREGWQRAQQLEDDLYIDSVALNLHGFYGGIKRLFELIASTIDENVPQDANWHQLLLQQIASEVPHKRPAVISEGTMKLLEAYRGFRHIVRNVYTFKFDPVKVEILVEKLPNVYKQVRNELLPFSDFLEQRVKTRE
jgi:hypothetical protein